jgi:hypothetical protein
MEGESMTKVGRFITDPRAGASCYITLDSGEKVVVNHHKGGFRGGSLSIKEVKWWGFGSGATLFWCDLDSPAGRAALWRLIGEAHRGAVEATPLGGLVAYVRDCGSVTEVRGKCEQLGQRPA